MPYLSDPGNCLEWPGVPGTVVSVGGTAVTCAEAASAIFLLRRTRTSAIAPVLAAAGHPLASCDYRAAAAPYLPWARSLPLTGRAGAAGRHVHREAFARAICEAVAAARDRAVAAALAAFASDERYAAAMAAEASRRAALEAVA